MLPYVCGVLKSWCNVNTRDCKNARVGISLVYEMLNALFTPFYSGPYELHQIVLLLHHSAL